MPTSKKNSRRNFISSILVAGTATGLAIPASAGAEAKSGSKVKMLTADGKLVEVDQSVLDKATSKRVSDKEIFEWMDEKHKK